MKTLWEIVDHVWKKGHGITVNRYITPLHMDTGSKGWLYKCECGKFWAR